MSKIYRFIYGFIIQEYTSEGVLIDEHFTTSDEEEWEDEQYEFIDPPDFTPVEPKIGTKDD